MKTCHDCIGYEYDTCSNFYTDEDMKEYTDGDIRNTCRNFKDKERFVELPCSIGDITYAIAYSSKPRAIQVRVFQILNFENSISVWVESTADKTDFWKLTVDQYNEWAKFLTKEDAKKKLEEWYGNNTAVTPGV